MKDALITGLHRSGTTLLCHLLNQLPNTVALDEPLAVTSFKNASESEIVDIIKCFFEDQRSKILSSGLATSKVAGGVVPTNQLSDSESSNGMRHSVIDGMKLKVTNVASHDFDLFIKHPAFFTALLPCLERHFPCYVNIRNPLSVLLSWRATRFNVMHGRAPAAEMMNAALKNRLDAHEDVLDRQLILLNFFYGRYAACNAATIIRYEDVIATSGRILSALNRQAFQLNVPLESRNSKEIGSSLDVLRVAERLLDNENACWLFYSRDDVRALLKPFTDQAIQV